MNRAPMILQLNFPFCFHKCSYCGISSCKYDSAVLSTYADAMVREIETVSEDMDEYEVTAISIEGGCPGLMLPADLKKVVWNAKQKFHLSENLFMSIQTMPGEYSRSLLDRMRDQGVNHWIFSIPTTRDYLHFLLERPYNLDTISMADTAIRNFAVRDLAFEIMYGIPGQTMHDFMVDLRKCLDYRPEHITIYPLCIQPRTKLFDKIASGEVEALDLSSSAEMYEAGKNLLQDLGYRQYTIHDFALEGHENRYLQQKLSGVSRLGIGYHASSAIDGVFYENGHSLDEYLQFSDNLQVLAKNLTAETKEHALAEEAAYSLQTARGILPERLLESYGDLKACQNLRNRLEALAKQETMCSTKDGFILTAKGIAGGWQEAWRYLFL